MASQRLFGWTVEGDTKASEDLQLMGVRASDIRRLQEVRSIFHRSEERRFAAGGPGWPPLADSTRERKQDPRILRATGALYRSLTAASASDQIDERRPDRLEFGTAVPYARFHEYGTRNMPRRVLIDLRPPERDEIRGVLERYIAKGSVR